MCWPLSFYYSYLVVFVHSGASLFRARNDIPSCVILVIMIVLLVFLSCWLLSHVDDRCLVHCFNAGIFMIVLCLGRIG